MVTLYDVDQQELVEKTAEELKKVKAIQPPEWAAFVKTSVSRERPPANDDWWYFRTASILKTVYKMGPIGVNKLKVKYGGKQRRGMAPPIFKAGSGNIIRKALQQLEKAGFVKPVEKGAHKGKIVTPLGKTFVDKIAAEITKNPKVKKERETKTLDEKPKAFTGGKQEGRVKEDKEKRYPGKKEGKEEKSEFKK